MKQPIHALLCHRAEHFAFDVIQKQYRIERVKDSIAHKASRRGKLSYKSIKRSEKRDYLAIKALINKERHYAKIVGTE